MRVLRFFELYLDEDCPYVDETTELLEISGVGTMKIISRERGVAACTEELSAYLSSLGLRVEALPSGSEFEPGATILSAEGDLKTLFRVWRVSQTFLSITCAIATETRRLVELAKKVNPNVIVATTRKTHPGMRYFEIKAVRAGGGAIHRYGLSDSILITKNHLNVIHNPEERLEILRKRTLRRIELEPRTPEEALRYAKMVDIVLLDHYSPKELEKLVPRLKQLNPGIVIAVAGNINAQNIAEYAKYADVIVTSAPYYAKPLDLTTKIERKRS